MRRVQGPSLVAYFSRSGNTRVVAGLIQRAFGAEVFEIAPANPYPEEYLATVEQARHERDREVRPALAAKMAGIERFRTIFLGFPIWGETAPPIIRSFLSEHELPGMTLIPFITHGGYGLGSSRAVLARHAPKARLAEGFVMKADQERETMDLVNAWSRRFRFRDRSSGSVSGACPLWVADVPTRGAGRWDAGGARDRRSLATRIEGKERGRGLGPVTFPEFVRSRTWIPGHRGDCRARDDERAAPGATSEQRPECHINLDPGPSPRLRRPG